MDGICYHHSVSATGIICNYFRNQTIENAAFGMKSLYEYSRFIVALLIFIVSINPVAEAFLTQFNQRDCEPGC